MHPRFTSAHGAPIPLSIPVVAHTPQLAWREAAWRNPQTAWQQLIAKVGLGTGETAKASSIVVTLDNIGQQGLGETEFLLSFNGSDQTLDTVTRATTPSGPLTDLNFSLPAGLVMDEDTRITLSAFQLGPPPHRWRFAEQPVAIPPPPWPLWLALAERLGSQCQPLGEGFWRLSLGEELPINLAECLLHLPAATQPAPAVLAGLAAKTQATDQVILILHPDEAQQRALHEAADDPGNLYVAPPGWVD